MPKEEKKEVKVKQDSTKIKSVQEKNASDFEKILNGTARNGQA